MKPTMVLFIIGALVCCFGHMSAQQPQGNVFVVYTAERAFPEDGSSAEFDSLTQLYTERVTKKNELILSQRICRHWWGSDNRQFVVIVEVKDWQAIEKAFAREDELFKNAFTKEEQDRFNKAYGRYFTGKHSDEIYTEVPGGRK
ncbi:MAG: hypothetical protein WB626_07850 [Bacteroidota bacterium]